MTCQPDYLLKYFLFLNNRFIKVKTELKIVWKNRENTKQKIRKNSLKNRYKIDIE